VGERAAERLDRVAADLERAPRLLGERQAGSSGRRSGRRCPSTAMTLPERTARE
jgi:hypothetical protein